MQHVGLIYDDSLRVDTTGGYCLRALEGMTAVSHLRPDRIGTTPLDADLILCIDDGLDFVFPSTTLAVSRARLGQVLRTDPSHFHSSAFWVIDTHLDFPRALRRSRGVDAVFAAQKEGAERLLSEGIPICEWLPLACDPETHRCVDVPKEYDVAFVGNPVTRERADFLTQVQRHFLDSFIGQAPHTQMGEAYSRARIVINHALANDLNMRIFEAMSCGSTLFMLYLHDKGQEDPSATASTWWNTTHPKKHWS